MRRVLSALAVTGCLLTSIPAATWAQSLPSFNLFSGVKQENQLPFLLEFGGKAGKTDIYRLRIPAQKMRLNVSQFAITYPGYYNGSFDTNGIEVRVGGAKVPISEVKWDKEARILEIFPTEPIPAGSQVALVLSNVQNPNPGGIFYFNCQILAPGDVPLLRYIGTWILSIE